MARKRPFQVAECLSGDELSDDDTPGGYDADSIGIPSDVEFGSDNDSDASLESQDEADDSSDDWYPGMSPKKKYKLPPKHKNSKPPPKKKRLFSTLREQEQSQANESEGSVLEEPPTDKGKPKFVCELCNKVLASKQSLTQHIVKKVCWTSAPSSATPFGRALWCRDTKQPGEKREGLKKVKCSHCSTTMTQEKLVTHVRSGVCWRTWDSRNPNSVGANYFPKNKHGPTMNCKQMPLADLYLQFLDAGDDSILDQWIEETNRQAEKLKEILGYFRHWKPLTKARAIRWIAVHHIISLRNPKRRKELWLKSEFYHCEFAVKHMSHREFTLILRATHFVNNDVELGPDGTGNRKSENWTPLWKILPIFHKLIRQCQRMFVPGVCIAIDESMLMPKKPIRKGPKIFGMADGETGYLLNFEVYCKQIFRRQGQMGYLSALVYALLESDCFEGGISYLMKGHKIYIDSFYTMIKLAEDLMEDQTYVVGSIKTDRHIPDCAVYAYHPVTGEKLKRGKHFFLHSNSGVQLTVWVDNSIVRIISTVPDVSEEIDNIGRTMKSKNWTPNAPEITLPYPRIVGDFNGSMDGLDLFNQLLAYNRTTHLRSRRWYIPLWIQVLEMAFVNTYCIKKWYLRKKPKKFKRFSTRDLKEKLVHDLLRKADELEGKVRTRTEEKYHAPIEFFLDDAGLQNAPKPKILGKGYRRDPATKKLRLELKKKMTPNEMFRKRKFQQHYSVPNGGWHQCQGCVYQKLTKFMCSVCLYPLCTWPCHVRFHELPDYRVVTPQIATKGKNKGKIRRKIYATDIPML